MGQGLGIPSDEAGSDNTSEGYARQAQYTDVQNLKFEVVTREQLTRDDIILVLMGRTGSGKSTLIEIAAGVQGWAGHTLKSCTNVIQAGRITFGTSIRVVLVDTPGFGDAYESDLKTLKALSDWLQDIYKKGLYPSGILFMHRAPEFCLSPTSLTSLKPLGILGDLCEAGVKSRLTTPQGSEEEGGPKVGGWVTVITDGGLRTLRFNKDRDSALEALSHAISKELSGRISRVRKELIGLKNLPGAQTSQTKQWITQQEEALEKLGVSSLSLSFGQQGFVNALTQLREMRDAIATETQQLDPSRAYQFRRLNETVVDWVFHAVPKMRKHGVAARRGQLRTSLSKAVMDNRQRAFLMELKGDDAQQMIDYLDVVLHESGVLAGEEGQRILALLCNLARSSGFHPRCHALKNVEFNRETDQIGGGAFADVYKGKHAGRVICLKFLRSFNDNVNTNVLKTHVKELALWAHLTHENILPFYGAYRSGKQICLVSPYMENESLRSFLKKDRDTSRKLLLLDVISGLAHLHQHNIIHGDLKAENVLISGDRRALIADFGLSHVATASKLPYTQTPNGTTRWRAPELFRYKHKQGGQADDNVFARTTKESDVWSYNCLCYEVLTGDLPFRRYSDDQVISILSKSNNAETEPLPGDDGDVADERLWAIMKACWNRTPQDRPSSDQVRMSIAELLRGVKDDRPLSPRHIWDTSAFWKAMKTISGVNISYEYVEKILLRIQKEIGEPAI